MRLYPRASYVSRLPWNVSPARRARLTRWMICDAARNTPTPSTGLVLIVSLSVHWAVNVPVVSPPHRASLPDQADLLLNLTHPADDALDVATVVLDSVLDRRQADVLSPAAVAVLTDGV